MSRGKHSEAEMIAALKQVEAGRKVEDVAREKPRFGYQRLHVLFASCGQGGQPQASVPGVIARRVCAYDARSANTVRA